MKLSVVTAIACALVLVASTVWGQVTYISPPVVGIAAPVVSVRPAPARVVYHYWPTAPVVVQPVVPAPGATVVAYPGTVVAGSVAVPATVTAPAPVIVPAALYPAPAVIRAKVYYPGQPVRNTLRAILP